MKAWRPALQCALAQVPLLDLRAACQQQLASKHYSTVLLAQPGSGAKLQTAATSLVCVGQQHPDWCPRHLEDTGCLEGLTRVAITPSIDVEEGIPDLCFALPKVTVTPRGASRPCRGMIVAVCHSPC